MNRSLFAGVLAAALLVACSKPEPVAEEVAPAAAAHDAR